MSDSALEKFICIHGHFYQPPRENAWLETIEIQESAAPYHDWNDRITDECYGPNCISRILNGSDTIVDIVNNFSKISFNFGPTLLSWLELNHPGVYSCIIESDALSQKYFNGHGSAIAQVYNHIIMPLANKRDKETQIKWGLYDFEKRFGRAAEGIWLAETAVDLETLELLVDNGLKFTILAPQQAKRYKKLTGDEWQNGIDTTKVYSCRLPSGRSIALYFYNGVIAQKVAFGNLLKNGRLFAEELMAGFTDKTDSTQLVHIATDGETFGHHHQHGDMALAYCIDFIQRNKLARITNYAEFLSLHSPEYEVEIHENTSWSCSHGVDRWKSDCGCKTGGLPHWNQKWRKPLREALDRLNQKFIDIYESEFRKYKIDPWHIRNEYIKIFQYRNRENTLAFIAGHFGEDLSEREITNIIRLLEMQKQAMFMYTSCGWFFNDISGIETIQILQYASRGIQLAEMATEKTLDKWFAALLKLAESNDPEAKDGEKLYNDQVQPKRLNLTQVGMHYAAHLMFSDRDDFEVLNYDCTGDNIIKSTAGSYTLVLGRVKVISKVTLISRELNFALLHLGNHHLLGNSSSDMPQHTFDDLSKQITNAFHAGNLMQVLEIMQLQFKKRSLTFHDLLKDEQLKLLETAIHKNIKMVIQKYEDINSRIYGLMNQMRKSNLHVPGYFIQNLSVLLSLKIEELFTHVDAEKISISELKTLTEVVLKWDLEIDRTSLDYQSTKALNALAYPLEDEQSNRESQLEKLLQFIDILDELKIRPHLHELQNIIFGLLIKSKEEGLSTDSVLLRLGEKLNLKPRE